MIKPRRLILAVFFLTLCCSAQGFARDGAIDTAEPTRIYSGFGVAAWTSDYENGATRRELRGNLSWALTPDDMLQVESGYGRHESTVAGGDTTGLTRTTLSYRQRLPFDDARPQGFRGMAFQYSLSLSGELTGTDGQTILSGGAIPAIRLSESFDFYPVVDLINSFDKNFKHYNGLGFDVAPRLAYTPAYLWPDATLEITPGYTKYLIGQLAFGTFKHLRAAVSGALFQTVHWTLSAEKFYGRDLTAWRGTASPDLNRDWSAALTLLATF